jgi:DNA-binding response OmpR family regulator
MTGETGRTAAGRFVGRRILVVDDDPDILASTSLSLQAEGAEVMTAEDGNTAVSLFASARPDGVVLDMMLPRRSGFLVLEKIRESADSPPVVMVTANQGRRHMTYAENLGVTAYLVKPVSMPRLLDVLAESMGLD